MKKSETILVTVLFVVALPLVFILYKVGLFGFMTFLVFLVLAIEAYAFFKIMEYKNVRRGLMRKYRSREVVENVIAKRLWTGQTAEQLEDSLGKPILKYEEKTVGNGAEVWKFHSYSGMKCDLRVLVECGKVSSWKQFEYKVLSNSHNPVYEEDRLLA
jgi:hypothetical protein